jgi:hypothetical protein
MPDAFDPTMCSVQWLPDELPNMMLLVTTAPP